MAPLLLAALSPKLGGCKGYKEGLPFLHKQGKDQIDLQHVS